jgi:short-subunit dehydrogenase
MAIECARRGFPLFLTDLSEKGNNLALYLHEVYGVETRFRSCNLASTQAREEFIHQLKAEGVQFGGLINVAGLDYEGAFLERTREQILAILQLNVESTLVMTHAILTLRDKEKRFMLLNTCSMAAFTPMPYKATYAATKRLLFDFSLALREEIKSFGTVTALCPGGMPTTPECMQAIFAQGFWGKMTTVNTDEVARQAITQALKGKAVVIPGFTNRFIQWLGALSPVALSIQMISKRWQKAQQSREISWQEYASTHSS